MAQAAHAAELGHAHRNENFQRSPSVFYQQPAVNRQQQQVQRTSTFGTFFQPQQQPQQQIIISDVSGSDATGNQNFRFNSQPQIAVLDQGFQQADDLQLVEVSANAGVPNQGFSQAGDLQIIGVSAGEPVVNQEAPQAQDNSVIQILSNEGDNIGSSIVFEPTGSQDLNVIPANLMLQMKDDTNDDEESNVLFTQDVQLQVNEVQRPRFENEQQTYDLPQLVSGNVNLRQQVDIPQTIAQPQPIINEQAVFVAEQDLSEVFNNPVIPDLERPQVAERPREQPPRFIPVDDTSDNSDSTIENEISTKPFTRPQFLKPATRPRLSSAKIERPVCSSGLLADARGNCVEPQVVRNVYLYAAPKQQRKFRTLTAVPKPKIEYNIVFVRNPEEDESNKPIVVPPPQQKTLVYVLNQKLADEQEQLITVPAHPKLEPEVYFVNYGENENPQLPGGIDLRSALREMVLEGTVIDNAADSLNSFVESVGGLDQVIVEDEQEEFSDFSRDNFDDQTFVTDTLEEVDEQTEAPNQTYDLPQQDGLNGFSNDQ